MTFIDECSHERRSRGCPFEPATDPAVLPPRSGFRRFFARPMLSHGRARPHVPAERLHPRWAARGPAPPVDFCNRITPRTRPWTIRTPRTTLAVAHQRSSSRGWLRLERRNRTLSGTMRTTHCARPTELSRARDQVSVVSHLRRPDASLRDRSRRELRPAPLGSDTSCRELVTRRTGAIPPRPCAVAGARSELAMARKRG